MTNGERLKRTPKRPSENERTSKLERTKNLTMNASGKYEMTELRLGVSVQLTLNYIMLHV